MDHNKLDIIEQSTTPDSIEKNIPENIRPSIKEELDNTLSSADDIIELDE